MYSVLYGQRYSIEWYAIMPFKCRFLPWCLNQYRYIPMVCYAVCIVYGVCISDMYYICIWLYYYIWKFVLPGYDMRIRVWFAIGIDIFILWYYGVVFVYYIRYAFCILLVYKSILCWKIGTVAIAAPCEHIDNCRYINTYLHIDKRRYVTYRYLSIYFCWWWFGSDDRKK